MDEWAIKEEMEQVRDDNGEDIVVVVNGCMCCIEGVARSNVCGLLNMSIVPDFHLAPALSFLYLLFWCLIYTEKGELFLPLGFLFFVLFFGGGVWLWKLRNMIIC